MTKTSDLIVLREKERQKTIKEQKIQQDKMHEQKMIELKFRRESEAIMHDHDLERFRIRNAEAQKMQVRKEQFFRQKQDYYKGGGR